MIRADVLAAITSFYYNRCRDLNLLNKANIILIPKKEGAEDIRDFRPISLIHAVAKIITKILALRLCDNPPRKIPYYRLRPIHFGH
jgi:mannosylglycoprotein endo-beta-mannosidase